MDWLLIPLVIVLLAAFIFGRRARTRPPRRRHRHTPHSYIPPCIEK